MDKHDTIESLGIKEPVLIPGLGKLFWEPSYRSAKGCDCSFESLMAAKWITHYSVPSGRGEYGGQSFSFTLRLDESTLGDGSFDNIEIDIDFLMREIETNFTVDWDQNATLDQLRLPKNFILALRSIMFNLHGAGLWCHNSSLDDEDPRDVSISFSDCQTQDIPRDELLLTVASVLETWISQN